MFLPLKAVVGALSVLVKNYDVRSYHRLVLPAADCIVQQTVANAEQINDIEERIESLSEILAFPAGDQDTEEMKRRIALRMLVFALQEALTNLIPSAVCRKLVRIIAELRPLSEQHGLAKFLKNADHASRLNAFVQDLAHAVTDYQVCCPNIIVPSV